MAQIYADFNYPLSTFNSYFAAPLDNSSSNYLFSVSSQRQVVVCVLMALLVFVALRVVTGHLPQTMLNTRGIWSSVSRMLACLVVLVHTHSLFVVLPNEVSNYCCFCCSFVYRLYGLITDCFMRRDNHSATTSWRHLACPGKELNTTSL